MKVQNNIIKGFFASAILSVALVSCSEDTMDKINRDRDHTVKVQSKFILADVITSTAFSNTGGDINTYTSTYIEHEAGVHNQLYSAEHRDGEPSKSTTFNNTWLSLYRSLKEARIVIDQTNEGAEAEDNTTRGIAQVLAAYNSALLADLFGDTPYSEAALIDPTNGLPKFMNPKIDKQEAIYNEVFTLLDDAIESLQGKDVHGIGGYDFIYNGNAALWTKFAYGLKARYTMRLIKQSSNVNADMEKVIDFASKSFSSAAEQAAFAIYDASNLNPLFDFQWSRDALAASESLSEKLIERNDPRLRRVFVDADWIQITGKDDEVFKKLMAPNGETEQVQQHYNTSIFVYSQTAPTLLLSYHEVLFLKAEALCRLNKKDEAEATLKEALVAAIENTEFSVRAAMNAPYVQGGLDETTEAITSEEAEIHFNTSVKPLFDANPLKETMVQKYLAFFGASGESTECYNDFRRLKGLGEDFVKLNNKRKFPLRLPYGGSDTVNNPNIKEIFGDGQYVYSEPVWWAGGTR